MNKWVYTVWFRDNNVSKVEEDYEWPACFIIEADTAEKAIDWGKKLANNYCVSNKGLEFLKCYIDTTNYPDKTLKELPEIKYGYSATDEEIGW